MNNKQNGFTLIEIMIVVGIIAFLVGTAVPMYQNYTVRSKVSEIMVMADAARNGIAEYYMEAGKMPDGSGISFINLDPSQSQYVSAINYSTTASTATVTYTLDNTGVPGELAIVGSVNSNTFRWVCDTPATTIDNKYLPVNCRR